MFSFTLHTVRRCVSASATTSSSAGSAIGNNSTSGGGWTAPQFRRWLAAYLRELRLSPDPVHRDLVLRSARPLLEADPSLGLSVFLGKERKAGVDRSHGHGVLARRRVGVKAKGGRGDDKERVSGDRGARLAPHDVVSFLKTIMPSEVGMFVEVGGDVCLLGYSVF